jgi:hypothetical protein
MAMAPVLVGWTAWLLVLWYRSLAHRTRRYHALAYVAVLVGVNATSIVTEAAGAVLTDESKWLAILVSTGLFVDMVRRTWRIDSPDSRALTPPDEAAIEVRIQAEVARQIEEERERLGNRAVSTSLAAVVMREYEEYEDGHATG